MEEQVQSLQKHIPGLIKMILDLKSRVEKIEGKSEDNHNDAFYKYLRSKKLLMKQFMQILLLSRKLTNKFQISRKQRLM